MGINKQGFSGGMHQDNAPTDQPKDTYRELWNGNIISQNGGHWSIETAKGNIVAFNIPPRYTNYIGSVATYDNLPTIIGIITFPDKAVVFSTNSVGTPTSQTTPVISPGGYGEIGILTVDDSESFTYTPLYYHEQLNFSISNQIRGIGYPENEKIQRVYWTDFNNEGRVLNVVDSFLTPLTAASNPIQLNVEYAVVGGIIEYNGVFYGEGLPAGNRFIGDGTHTTWANILANPPLTNPIVTKYININSISSNSDSYLGNIDYVGFGSGGLTGGSKQYFYRLGFASQGFFTGWSYGSFPINIRGTETFTYKDQQGCGVLTTNSGHSLTIGISNINTIFDTIEVVCASYDAADDVITKIVSIFRGAITGNYMTFTHGGSENIASYSTTDITTFQAPIKKYKDLATNKNYLVIGNIVERQEIDFDATPVTISDKIYLTPADKWGSTGNGSNFEQGTGYIDASYMSVPSPPTLTIYPDGKYLVKGGALDVVVYNGTSYFTGEVFVGVMGHTTFTHSTGATVTPCIAFTRYLDNLGNPVLHVVEKDYDFWDNKSMAITEYIRQYMSKETYRFAIIFFDKQGNPYFGRWIGDHTIQSIKDKGGLLKMYAPNSVSSANGFSDLNFSYQMNGIQIDGIKISPSMLSSVSGFSIMRAPRDAQRYGQGLIVQAVPNQNDTTSDAPRLQPLGGNAMSFDGHISGTYPSNNPYFMYSPDFIFGDKNTTSINVRGNKLEIVDFIDSVGSQISYPVQNAFSSYIPFTRDQNSVLLHLNIPSPHNTDVAWGSKFYLSCINNPAGADPAPVEQVIGINQAATLIGNATTDGFDPSYEMTNQNITTVVPPSKTNTSMVMATGTPCLAIRLDGGISAPTALYPYNVPYLANMENQNDCKYLDFTQNGFGGLTMKALGNIYIPKANLYGGTNPEAIANTPFISTGHYQDLTNIDLTTIPVDGSGNYLFNGIEVFGGDTFLNIIDLTRCLYFDFENGHTKNGGNVVEGGYSNINFFAVETCINTALREGKWGSKDGIGPSGIFSVSNNASNPETYQSNLGYESEGDAFEYPSLPVNFSNAGDFSYRVRWAGPKISGEIIDSFRKFLVNNFRDLNGASGEINNLDVSNERMFAWQNKSISYLPILERVTTDSGAGEATQLGIGGVIDRFDEINNFYGNQHQNSLCKTEFGYVWFDMRRRAICSMTSEGSVESLSDTKGLASYMKSIFEQQGLPNHIFDSDTPLVGCGICSVYDPTYKMTFLTFKNVYGADDDKIKKDFTIGYSHLRNVFVGFFDWCPNIVKEFNTYILASNNPVLLNDSSVSPPIVIDSIQPGTNYVIGDEVVKNNITYVCYTPFTTNTPVQPFQEPDAASSAFWKQTFASNESYVSWKGDLAKFFGVVKPMTLEYIINPQTRDAFTVDNIETKGSNVSWDSVFYSTDSDNNTDYLPRRDYRFFDGKWFNSIPIGLAYGRLTDTYLSVKSTIKNYLTDPTISRNVDKLTTFVIGKFRERK